MLVNVSLYLLVRDKVFHVDVDCVRGNDQSADGLGTLVSEMERVVIVGVKSQL